MHYVPQAAAGGLGAEPGPVWRVRGWSRPLPSGPQCGLGTSVQVPPVPPTPGQPRSSREPDTRFQSPPCGLPPLRGDPRSACFLGWASDRHQGLRAPGRVASDLAGWPRPAGATAGNLPLTAPPAPAAWGLPGRLRFLCKQPGRGARPLDGSSVTANPARGRAALGRWSGPGGGSVAAPRADSRSCCPHRGPRSYLA